MIKSNHFDETTPVCDGLNFNQSVILREFALAGSLAQEEYGSDKITIWEWLALVGRYNHTKDAFHLLTQKFAIRVYDDKLRDSESILATLKDIVK